jgi:hypothetical protein
MNLMLINVSTRKFRRAVRLPAGDVPAPAGSGVSMGGKIVRTIGIARARFKIGMMNLGYNIPAWFSSGGWRLRPLACVQGGVCVARAEGTARSPASRQIGPRSSLTLLYHSLFLKHASGRHSDSLIHPSGSDSSGENGSSGA